MHVSVCAACMCVCACVHVCVRACVRVCVCAWSEEGVIDGWIGLGGHHKSVLRWY